VANDILLMMVPPYNSEEVLGAFERGDYAFVLEKALPHAVVGNADAQCTIALLYQCGFGVPQNFLEAESWLLRATEHLKRKMEWRQLHVALALNQKRFN
jgi:TPR repeat protein